MRQKREHFQKQIRRQKIQTIFKANRQKFFNYTYNNNQLPTQTVNQIKDQCIEQFTRYITEIEEAIIGEKQLSLCTSVKESALFLKIILIKAKNSADCITFIVKNWFNLAFDQRLFESVAIFIPFTQQQFSGVRKQTYKYALQHFSLIFQYEGIIQRKSEYVQKLLRFLFLIIVELGNEPESILDIMYLLNAILLPSVKVRQDFFFNNRFENNKSKTLKICFEHLISVIFQNKEKMSMPNNENQITNYHQLKMFFIDFFTMFCSQLKSLEKYIENCKQVGANNMIPNSQKLGNQIYENTLGLVGFPEEVKLKVFLEKSQITIIHGVITEMKALSFQNISEGPEYKQNLAMCLQAFRGLIQFHQNEKILKSFENQLQFLIEKLCSNEYNILVKNEIIMLIDTIIFLDKDNKMTNYLIQSHDLFQKVWSYEDKNVFHVKLNILNNIILSDAGFQIAMRFSSQIYITLCETRYVSLAQTFCINYFAKTEYSLAPNTKYDMVLDILYSLPIEHFGVQQIEKDYYIFAHLYEHGFYQQLPQRYKKFSQSDYHLKFDKTEGQNDTKYYDHQQKIILIEKMFELKSKYIDDSFMEE